MAKISVIVPVFNIEAYLPKCIESICTQTFKDLEIILVDDGSTDLSGRICDEYAQKDERIIVIHKDNEGLVRARKTGLKRSTSKYATYVDGDDWIDAEAYEHMYQDIVRYDAGIVFYEHFDSVGDRDIHVHHNVPYGYHDRDSLEKNIFPDMIAGQNFFDWRLFTSVWDALFDRELLSESQMKVDDRLTIGEDVACVYPALLEAKSVFVSEQAYYHYRQSQSSMVKKISDKAVERERYAVLFHSVKKEIEAHSMPADVMRQWDDMLLFVMIPRADQLFDGIEDLDYIFPFKNMKKGKRIALYCAGTYGQRLYSYIKQTKMAEVVIWVDRNYEELQKMGLPVENPELLTKAEFDELIIANMFAKSRTEILKYVKSLNLGVPIGYIEEDFVRSDTIKKGFRLI